MSQKSPDREEIEMIIAQSLLMDELREAKDELEEINACYENVKKPTKPNDNIFKRAVDEMKNSSD